MPNAIGEHPAQTPRPPAVVAAVQRCYRLGEQHRAATDPVTRADLRTSMADAVAALDAARHGRERRSSAGKRRQNAKQQAAAQVQQGGGRR